ncbi:membrane protein [Devosia pacifica]|uniref:Membrane protein n=1 Tax=Devosia pacifica TaxID=1335967 RepID=A0A918SET8_9HYPH|nr:O-antigen ligase family protein [Devosia pacifica]GHA36738.1 membrane protein [Devosia pacifica]
MSLAGSASSARPQGALGHAVVRERAQRLLNWTVALWIACGGFVFIEPSPYEIAFLLVLAVATVGGFGLYRGTLGLLAMVVAFIPFALIAALQVRHTPLDESLIFVIVTFFLLLTSYFLANFVADAPIQRTRLVMRAYLIAALLSAIIGITAYLGFLPAAEQFMRYGRAKAMFKDPNVYGPFLILPAMFLLQRVLLRTGWKSIFAAAGYSLLLVGVFVSFSRAAWGHLAVSSLMVLVLCFVLEANARDKVRIMMLSIAGTVGLVVLLAGLLSIPQVGELFETRTESQNYDTGATGRFGRQAYAFDLALRNPLGIGPGEFSSGVIVEEPHNTYVNVLHVYGWGGGALYYLLIGTTLWIGFSSLLSGSPLRPLMIPLISTYAVLILEAVIIDTDHWRHYFFLVGMIWGVGLAMRSGPRRLEDRASAVL